MSIRNKITKGVDTAFAKVGDLAETVTLKSNSSETYDFTTGTKSVTVTESSVTAIVISVEEDPNAESIGAPKSEVYIKETDLENPKLYDVVTIAGQDYTILSYRKDPGLITLLVTEG